METVVMNKQRLTRVQGTHFEESAELHEQQSTKPVLPVTNETIEGLTDVFKILSDPSRLKIMLALAQEGRMHVSALKDLLDQTQPAVSHHLTLMRMAKLVGFSREGKHNYYHLASDNLRNLLEQFFIEVGNGSRSLRLQDVILSYRSKKRE